jgi:hypothetical protein
MALALWDEEKVVVPIRLLGLSLSSLEPHAGGQLGLFDAPAASNALGPTLDAIQERFGTDAIRRGSEGSPPKITPSFRWKRGE